MTTREAFQMLVENPYLWSKTGVRKESRHVYKHRIAKGEWPSLDTMEAMIRAVFEVKQEKTWKLRA